MYAFATGNYLSFLKLVNGLNGNDGNTHCTDYTSWPSRGWWDICYQPVEHFQVSGINIRSHGPNHQEDYDYPTQGQGVNGLGLKEKSPIAPAGFIGAIRVQFEFVDTDACGGSPDYVEFQDASGAVLLRIKGQNLGPGAGGDAPAYAGHQLGDQGSTWTDGSYMDSNGWTGWVTCNTSQVRVFFFNGSDNHCDNGGGDDRTRGFNIIGYEYTTIASDNAELTCCNGPDGMVYKIQSRIDIARTAMAQVVDATRDTLNWGLAVFPLYSYLTDLGDAELRTNFDEGPDAVIADIRALNPYGHTPTGSALQLAYNYLHTYLSDNPEEAACANNYILLVTDGFPNKDTNWTLVTTNSGGTPNFSQPQYADSDTWTWYWNTEEPEHADDVASWMAGWQNAQPVSESDVGPDFNMTTHAIGFNFDNPLLADIADDGSGLSITAHNRDELINAFYTLTLTMASTVSFIAPVVSVEEANRTQSGDKIYMAFFRPIESGYWQGNLKKFGLDWRTRTDCGRTEGEWTVVDRNGNVATACDGSILGSATSYWSESGDGVRVNEGGVGALLMDAINAVDLGSGPYYGFRNIYTYKNNSLVRFTPENITNADLAVLSDSARYKIINFIYGYTYAEDGSGNPVAKRNWILGDIIHSESEVIEYFDPAYGLLRRFVAVGANDGLLHVFVDYDSSGVLTEGTEVFAFVPADLLDDLKNFENPTHFYTVDGAPNLWRGSVADVDGDSTWDTGEYYEKILVFGERRGGRYYWALDVSDPDPDNWTVRWRIQSGWSDPSGNGFHQVGQTWNKPQFASIRTGSNSFRDLCIFAGGYDPEEDNYPEPFDDSQVSPNGRWDTGEDYDDWNHNWHYDVNNLSGSNDIGRSIFVVDVTDGSHVFSRDRFDTGYDQMRWCFPADPTVIPISTSRLVIYAPDIYGQIWKVTYTDTDTGSWSAYRIFKANPGSDMLTGDTTAFPGEEDANDTGRKMFYGPDVSYFGNCWSTYPVLYFGTGDREHPNYSMVSNRFYAIKDTFGIYDITEETDLVNLTCNELEDVTIPDLDGDGDGDVDDLQIQADLKALLTSGEARGIYRVLDEQGDCVIGMQSHTGEKMLSQPTLFFNNLYFSTYQPVYDDPCNAGGNTYIYALDYCWLTSVFDLYSGNSAERDIRDTYQMLTSSNIPSGVRVITRSGEAAGIISVAGAVSGAGEDQTTKIPAPPAGVTRMLWETE